MDVDLIVGALSAGVIAGTQEVATAAMKDAYDRLKSALSRAASGDPVAQTALEQHETAPDVWAAPLMSRLEAQDVTSDRDVIAAATDLIRELESIRKTGDIYFTHAPDSYALTIGNGNTVNNNLGIRGPNR